ncbi:MAG: hypothetical protein FRX48_00163 [Lasallia pustulata]|uniref:Uncharacterized protein n=1 Tax=Lasallia pustulata TaxID=136370 RepID=A0A5M8Q057_9LECA|nr:MAG: hypothetical protein FRX48_00163 [Lasallia pustulata]
MSTENSPPPSPSARRASFSPGQKFSELFGRSASVSGGATATSAYPGSIANAAANVQRQQGRRMSISTLGLSGSPTQTSPFAGPLGRRESCSSGGSGSPSTDENAVEDGDAGTSPASSSPFARRMSFGARALRDVRTGNGNFNGRASISSLASSPSAHRRDLSSSHSSTSEDPRRLSNAISQRSGEGFNWSDQLRSKAERSSSITGAAGAPATTAPPQHQRAVNTTVMEAPVKEMPKTPKAPDHFQERILKGDFYMD